MRSQASADEWPLPRLTTPNSDRSTSPIRGEDVMSVQDASALLGITPRTAYRLVRDGKLPGARRLGRRVIVVRPVLERWLITGDPSTP
jgi:excisionase family DNA binding protein